MLQQGRLPAALAGVRVLDLSRLIPGPFGTLVLADLGAQVDKIEDAGAGDYLRYVPPQRAGASAGFHLLNRGKRSAIVDLKRAEGRAAFMRLLGRYDVLFEQFRPGVLDRLGLSHAALRERHPRLIICALTGYGQTGPLSQRAGHDLNYLARAGLLGSMGPSAGPPQVPGFQLADVSGGMWCVIAILAALRQRDATGQGTVCDIAMSDGVLGFAALSIAAGLAGESVPRGDETLTGGIAPYNTYLAKDGAPMTLAALEPKFWTAFCAAVGLECDTSALVPGPHQAALKARVAEIFAGRTRAEWEAFAENHDCLVEPVLAPNELAGDAHTRARGLTFELNVAGESVPEIRTPVSSRDHAGTAAPMPGQHTREIFREAGFDETEIAELFKARAIG
jgi:crotonobetainyl-CoA:carnitine CoA-transferase CaiB-like acyl-CoA transferase